MIFNQGAEEKTLEADIYTVILFAQREVTAIGVIGAAHFVATSFGPPTLSADPQELGISAPN